MNLSWPSKHVVVLMSFAAAACGSTGLVLTSGDAGGASRSDGGIDSGGSPSAEPDGAIPDSSPPVDVDAGDAAICAPPSPGAWSIRAADYPSHGCKTDSDCAPIVIGDDVCTAETPDAMVCNNYAILASSHQAWATKYGAIIAQCRAACATSPWDCPVLAVYCDKSGVAGPTCEVCPGYGCPDGGIGQ